MAMFLWLEGKVLTKVISIASCNFPYGANWHQIAPYSRLGVIPECLILEMTFEHSKQHSVWLTRVFCTSATSVTLLYRSMLRSYTDKHVPSSQQSNWAQLLPPFLFSVSFLLSFPFSFFLSPPTFISQVLLREVSTGWSLFSSSSPSTPLGLEEQRGNGLWEAHSISKGVREFWMVVLI